MNLDVMLTRFDEHWSPKMIAQVNDHEVRIVKLQGEFTWHRHAETAAGRQQKRRLAHASCPDPGPSC